MKISDITQRKKMHIIIHFLKHLKSIEILTKSPTVSNYFTVTNLYSITFTNELNE